MPLTTTNAESQSLTPTALLTLFTLDLTPIGTPVQYYFADGTSCNYQPIVFAGTTYTPFPIVVRELGYDGQGGINRPKITVSNIGGFVSALLLQNQDLVGAQVSIVRVYARFIDAVNYPGGVSPYTPDSTAAYSPEVYFVNRKISENQAGVEFELGTAFELDNRRLPSRTCLANFCVWRSREAGTCGYSGAPVSDQYGRLFTSAPYNYNSLNSRGLWNASTSYSVQDYVTIFSTNQALLGVPQVYVCTNANTDVSPLLAGNTSWVQDACVKTLAGCRGRYPYPAILPIGSYPGLTISPFTNGYSTVNT